MGFVINDNSIDNTMLLYGNLLDMEPMFIPRIDTNDTNNSGESEEIEIEKSETSRRLNFISDSVWDDLKILNGKLGRDIEEFNELTNMTRNITRRWGSFYNDPGDYDAIYYKRPYTLEPEKKDMLNKVNIQFVIHARYFIKRVFEKRQHIRFDKRYKMGFLFNRLRKIKQEQLKLVSAAREFDRGDYRRLRDLMKIYQKIVRYDVDINDISILMKSMNRDEKLVPYFLPEMITTTTVDPDLYSIIF